MQLLANIAFKGLIVRPSLDRLPAFQSPHTMNEALPTCTALNRHRFIHIDPENPESIRKNNWEFLKKSSQ